MEKENAEIAFTIMQILITVRFSYLLGEEKKKWDEQNK